MSLTVVLVYFLGGHISASEEILNLYHGGIGGSLGGPVDG